MKKRIAHWTAGVVLLCVVVLNQPQLLKRPGEAHVGDVAAGPAVHRVGYAPVRLGRFYWRGRRWSAELFLDYGRRNPMP